MKTQKRILLLLTLVALPMFAVFSQKKSTLKIDFKFENIKEGYNHLTKTVVYIDDELVATSKEKLQSIPNSVTVKIPKGTHTVRVVNLAQYEGVWEEHTIENNYSVDCLYEFTENFKNKKYSLKLVFDLDSDTKVTFK